MKVGSLFSGIGGIDLGLERAGMTVIWQSEVDPYACRVLAKHWPHTPNLGDVAAVDWSTVERPDLICGGYPCQPFSYAGIRGGDTDARHLWPHMRDALRHLRPRYALLENVPGHLSLGFGRVLGDLAECGYDTEWDCIPAAAVGAPHLRYRVFVVAHAAGVGDAHQSDGGDGDLEPVGAVAGTGSRAPLGHPAPGDRLARGSGRVVAGDVADADGERRQERGQRHGIAPAGFEPSRGRDPGGRGADDGDHWAVEPDVDRVAHGVPARMDRLRTLGNAVVPQVAEWIGRRLMEGELDAPR